ncbi:MAG: hypothetical protein M0006_09615 [Magnetospirillum sp.]|nr:hypothetical protein [Magnetospirillum sp.]
MVTVLDMAGIEAVVPGWRGGCGRGWVVLGTAGRLVGHIFIHNGDESGFVCEPD